RRSLAASFGVGFLTLLVALDAPLGRSQHPLCNHRSVHNVDIDNTWGIHHGEPQDALEVVEAEKCSSGRWYGRAGQLSEAVAPVRGKEGMSAPQTPNTTTTVRRVGRMTSDWR
ncbi:unnamed protein product, partial [Ixodes pacificus]